MIFSRSAQVPLSNRDLARQCFMALQELKRARALGMDTRELWFEDRMNEALDVLSARRQHKAPPPYALGPPL